MSKRRLKRHQNFALLKITGFSPEDTLVASVLDSVDNVDEIERLFGTLTKILDFYYLFHLFFRNKHCFVTLKDALHLPKRCSPNYLVFLRCVQFPVPRNVYARAIDDVLNIIPCWDSSYCAYVHHSSSRSTWHIMAMIRVNMSKLHIFTPLFPIIETISLHTSFCCFACHTLHHFTSLHFISSHFTPH